MSRLGLMMMMGLAAGLPAAGYDEAERARQDAERDRRRAERDDELARRLAAHKPRVAVADQRRVDASDDRRRRKHAARWADAVLSGQTPRGWTAAEPVCPGGIAVRSDRCTIDASYDGAWGATYAGGADGGREPTQRRALIAALLSGDIPAE